LKQAALANPHPLQCIHCGSPVSTNAASVVEAGKGDGLTVGLSHADCLAPDDRVLGTVRSRYFEENPTLINFDFNGWFRASNGRQIGFSSAELVRSRRKQLVWGGRRLRGPAGPFVVELLLRGGGREFAWVRNGIHRFSRAGAEDFVARFNADAANQGAADPFCYTEQTKAFGRRSLLTEQFGGRERLYVIESARVRPYDQHFAARYTRPGNWYAPLLYLRDLLTGEALSILGSVVLLREPLSLPNYLDNWREAGVPIPKYETISLLTDRDFDDFMLLLDDNKMGAIVDPMIASDTSTHFVNGIPIRSVEAITASI
jgi:hypothetical protein